MSSKSGSATAIRHKISEIQTGIFDRMKLVLGFLNVLNFGWYGNMILLLSDAMCHALHTRHNDTQSVFSRLRLQQGVKH